MIKVTCFGPRGSIPSPSYKGQNGEPDFTTVEYGGNTSCYFVEAGPFRVILDNGSGCRVLGNRLMRDKVIGKHFINLLSHYHWDHVQGLPFCVPYFIASNTFHIHGHRPISRDNPNFLTQAVEQALSEQQATPHFPVGHGSLPAKRHYHSHLAQFSESFYYWCNDDGSYEFHAKQTLDAKGTLSPDQKLDPSRWIEFTTIPLNHPDGCLGWRVKYMGDAVAYCSDDEPLRHPNAQVVRHCKGVKLFIGDGQYTEEQIASMTQTFGHGTPRSVVEHAQAIDAELAVVHHFDPGHDDAKLSQMEADANHWAHLRSYRGKVEFAKEGVTWAVGS